MEIAQEKLIAGRFEIERLAGSGGMGAVYRAQDRHTGQPVALKLLRDAGPRERQRFLRESRLLCELCHPHIVAYVAHGSAEDGHPYLAMEWLEGEDLSRHLSRGPLSLAAAMQIVHRVAAALALAHGGGVIHRDLKPTNLFLCNGDPARVKVLDFGIARRLSRSQALTQSGALIGTPEYMAPEQARGEGAVGPAVDIFALGCVLYECLTGRPPFQGEHLAAVLIKILLEEPEPVERWRPGVPVALSGLLTSMLAKHPAARPADGEALLLALKGLGGLDEATLPAPLVTDAQPPGSFGDSEQFLLSVVLAMPPAQAAGETLPTEALEAVAQQQQEVRDGLRGLGIHVQFLLDGTAVLTLPRMESAVDQAVQAARAALLLKERWPAARVALATGRGEPCGPSAVGEVVDRATQLAQAGGPAVSGVWVDELSAGLLPPGFAVTPTRSGKVLLREEQVFDDDRPLLGRPTPCIGREAELGLLEGLLKATTEACEAQVAIVSAPPGVGKSRLRQEFLRRLRQRGEALTVLTGRGDLMRAGAAYGLLGDALRRHCGLGGGAPPDEGPARLREHLSRHLPATEVPRVVEFLGELCGLPAPGEGSPLLRGARQDPRGMRDHLRRAFVDWLAAECQARPVLLVLDDLHWGDALSTGLVDEALGELRDAPLLVLGLGRPEIREIFPRLWQSRRVQEMMLRGLSKRSCQRLVEHALGAAADKDLVARLVDQADGNALFLEELIRAAAEGKAEAQPETVVAMLQARIGRLQPGPRRAVRAAALFGQTCWREGVAVVLGPQGGDLDACFAVLVKEEFLEVRAQSRLRDLAEYGFRHALLREAAYALLVDGDRANGHRLAGEFLERAGEPDARIIAEHAERGGNLSRAVEFYVRAAEDAFARNDVSGVLARAEQALRCRPREGDLGKLRALQSVTLIWSGEWLAAFGLGQEALGLLPPGDPWWCRAISDLIIVASNMPDPAAIRDLADRLHGVDLAQAAVGPYARALGTLVMQLGVLGQRGRAQGTLSLAQRVSAGLDGGSAEAVQAYLWCCQAYALLLADADPFGGLCAARRGAEYFRAVEDWRSLAVALIVEGMSHAELGDVRWALVTLAEVSRIGQRLGEGLAVMLGQVYSIYLLCFDPDAKYQTEPSQVIESLPGGPVSTVRGLVRSAAARLALARQEGGEAEGLARAAIPDLPMMMPFRLMALGALAEALLLQGRPVEAVAVAEEGLGLLDALGGSGIAEVPLRLAASEAFHAAGEGARARAQLAEALRQVRLRAAGIPDKGLQEGYLTKNRACARVLALARAWGLDGALD